MRVRRVNSEYSVKARPLTLTFDHGVLQHLSTEETPYPMRPAGETGKIQRNESRSTQRLRR